MSMTGFLSRSRGYRNLVSRIGTVLARFGISARRYQVQLNRFRSVTADLDCEPTFAVTAVTLRRHPELMRELSRQGAELAVHGYVHTDYQTMPADSRARHFGKAIDVFRQCQVPFTGFRAPFLRLNGTSQSIISEAGFAYDSSLVAHWDVLDRASYPARCWREYERLLAFYNPIPAEHYLVLPRKVDGFVEIPVSIPDDEAMMDRLGTGSGEIAVAWNRILDETHTRGELFTIQLHPERFSLCEDSLVDVLQRARRQNPSVWIATLGGIADWWKEKEGFVLDIGVGNGGRYEVKATCSPRATLLARKCSVDVPSADWTAGYRCIEAGEFVVESAARPAIGVAPDTAPAAISFLRAEGFAVEAADSGEGYGLFLSGLAQFRREDEKGLVERIEASDAPLIRFWRWPDRSRSALSVTGDIDAITLFDFAWRIVENWCRDRI